MTAIVVYVGGEPFRATRALLNTPSRRTKACLRPRTDYTDCFLDDNLLMTKSSSLFNRLAAWDTGPTVLLWLLLRRLARHTARS